MANLQHGRRGKRITPEDFIGKPPRRARPGPGGDLAGLVEEAKAKGLKGPWK
ncbi:MAG: hypothetical protein M1598_01965 [Actinobacteria bacterium]|nr:hypothetical protein [Actinomycetota bacterium]